MTAGEMDMHDCGPAVMPDCCVTTASVDGLQALIPASAHRLDSPLALLAGPVVTIATASARSSVGGPLLLAAPSPPSFFLASALRI
jgi:acetyl-CoA acetyltransferase